MNKEGIRRRIEEVGIVPSIRLATMDDALFVVQAVAAGGINVVEIALTVPNALSAISQLAQSIPEMLVGAGGVRDPESARRCLDAGAQFLTTDGFDAATVVFAKQHEVVILPGALTPTEVNAAWKLEPDFIKIVPCGHIGGDRYFRSLKFMFPEVSLIAAGGVTQHNAAEFIRAGAVALGAGRELLPRDAIKRRDPEQIVELTHRFLDAVRDARAQFGKQHEA